MKIEKTLYSLLVLITGLFLYCTCDITNIFSINIDEVFQIVLAMLYKKKGIAAAKTKNEYHDCSDDFPFCVHCGVSFLIRSIIVTVF